MAEILTKENETGELEIFTSGAPTTLSADQIVNFTKSVYHRIREIKFKETFPINDPDLYPCDYLIYFARDVVRSKTIHF